MPKRQNGEETDVTMETHLIISLGIILGIAMTHDIFFKRIPNWLTLPSMLVALATHTFSSGWQGLFASLSGIGLGIGLLIALYLAGGMGAGDVKLMGAVGGFLGPKGLILAALLTGIAGGIYALALLVARGVLRTTLVRCMRTLRTMLLTGTFVYLPADETADLPQLRYGIAIGMGTTLAMAVMKMQVLPIFR